PHGRPRPKEQRSEEGGEIRPGCRDRPRWPGAGREGDEGQHARYPAEKPVHRATNKRWASTVAQTGIERAEPGAPYRAQSKNGNKRGQRPLRHHPRGQLVLGVQYPFHNPRCKEPRYCTAQEGSLKTASDPGPGGPPKNRKSEARGCPIDQEAE